LADTAVVDDAGAGNVDRADAGGVGLELAEPLGGDHFALDAIRLAALVDLLERGDLAGAHGDDHFGAALEGELFALAELLHRPLAGEAVDRLERPRLVVDGRVEDP